MMPNPTVEFLCLKKYFYTFTMFCNVLCVCFRVYLISDWELSALLSTEWNWDVHCSSGWFQPGGGVRVAVSPASSRGPTGWRLKKKCRPRISSTKTPVQLRSTESIHLFLVLFLLCKEYIIHKLSSLLGITGLYAEGLSGLKVGEVLRWTTVISHW